MGGGAGVSRGRWLLFYTGWTCSHGTVSAQKSFLQLLIITSVSLLPVVASNIRIMVELLLYSLFPNFFFRLLFKETNLKTHLQEEVLVAQPRPTLCNPMNSSPSASSVHGILQVRILEWVAFPFSRGSSQSRDQTQVSRTEGRFFTI